MRDMVIITISFILGCVTYGSVTFEKKDNKKEYFAHPYVGQCPDDSYIIDWFCYEGTPNFINCDEIYSKEST